MNISGINHNRTIGFGAVMPFKVSIVEADKSLVYRYIELMQTESARRNAALCAHIDSDICHLNTTDSHDLIVIAHKNPLVSLSYQDNVALVSKSSPTFMQDFAKVISTAFEVAMPAPFRRNQSSIVAKEVPGVVKTSPLDIIYRALGGGIK